VLQDVGAVFGDPRDEILRYPVLVPPPLLAAPPALPAILFLRHEESGMVWGVLRFLGIGFYPSATAYERYDIIFKK
jgi:hypothetical protein